MKEDELPLTRKDLNEFKEFLLEYQVTILNDSQKKTIDFFSPLLVEIQRRIVVNENETREKFERVHKRLLDIEQKGEGYTRFWLKKLFKKHKNDPCRDHNRAKEIL